MHSSPKLLIDTFAHLPSAARSRFQTKRPASDKSIGQPITGKTNSMSGKGRGQPCKFGKLRRKNLDLANHVATPQASQPAPPCRMIHHFRHRRETKQFLGRMPSHMLPYTTYPAHPLIVVQQRIHPRIGKIHHGNKAAFHGAGTGHVCRPARLFNRGISKRRVQCPFGIAPPHPSNTKFITPQSSTYPPDPAAPFEAP